MLFRRIWNVLLLVLAITVSVLSVPNIMGQLQMVLRDGWAADPLPLVWLAEMVGLLIFELLVLMSLGTWTWNLVGPRMRWLFATATALLLAGASVAAAVDYMELNYLFFDFITFAICVVAMSFPIIFLRTGYVGLFIRVWRRCRDKSAVA
jgi:hypothetical protein